MLGVSQPLTVPKERQRRWSNSGIWFAALCPQPLPGDSLVTAQRFQNQCFDLVSERNNYRDEVSVLAEKILDSENSVDILADFLTHLVFSNVDNADPAEILDNCRSDWEGPDEDDLCDTYEFSHEEE